MGVEAGVGAGVVVVGVGVGAGVVVVVVGVVVGMGVEARVGARVRARTRRCRPCTRTRTCPPPAAPASPPPCSRSGTKTWVDTSHGKNTAAQQPAKNKRARHVTAALAEHLHRHKLATASRGSGRATRHAPDAQLPPRLLVRHLEGGSHAGVLVQRRLGLLGGVLHAAFPSHASTAHTRG
jgi:hypothetical protein